MALNTDRLPEAIRLYYGAATAHIDSYTFKPGVIEIVFEGGGTSLWEDISPIGSRQNPHWVRIENKQPEGPIDLECCFFDLPGLIEEIETNVSNHRPMIIGCTNGAIHLANLLAELQRARMTIAKMCEALLR